jgi:hypothetical protein
VSASARQRLSLQLVAPADKRSSVGPMLRITAALPATGWSVRADRRQRSETPKEELTWP